MQTNNKDSKVSYTQVGNIKLSFVSDLYNGERLDTKVYIGNNYLTVIAGSTIEDFTSEFGKLIYKYKI